jgi:predicted NACHT family NTPase
MEKIRRYDMKRLKQIQQTVLSLSTDDFRELYRWVIELDHMKWDKEIEEDSKSGLLDELADQAVADYKKRLSKRL